MERKRLNKITGRPKVILVFCPLYINPQVPVHCLGFLSSVAARSASPPTSAQKNEAMGEEGATEGVVAAEPVAPSVPGEPMDIMTALQLVLRKLLAYGGLARSLKLVKALCAEHNVSLLTVPSAKTLGEWAGLCKIDSEGKARKVNGCSCVVVKDLGEEHEAYNVVLQHVKSQ
ncbi:hypothetical protein RJT34_00698 [Clitoria ternatea]|uniref:Ribosomal protein eL8/eL30/eS12/Gadd45 domain-containing protein n=1 Tax=Clitoria ternatea TaxID=43366 RepID=A0AAN9KGC5_CLITE